jgi:hypothetical protein
MAKLINELLLLTCTGGFIASATYGHRPRALRPRAAMRRGAAVAA